ncbi:MAG TPA: hypothetical protein VK957_21285 [Lunatimonas sp.]|nr:hypothetical protein [Lunatimonas sp.]
MMNDICGINSAPLVLGEVWPHDSIALAGYANAFAPLVLLSLDHWGISKAPTAQNQ